MKISIKDVEHIAKLAKLYFNKEEIISFKVEFEKILLNFESINALSIDESEIEIDYETYRNSVREDICIKNSHSDLMSNTKCFHRGYIEVPKIIE